MSVHAWRPVAVVMALALSLAACALPRTTSTPTAGPTSGPPPTMPWAPPTQMLLVAGRWVPAVGVHSVVVALRVAGVKIPSGRLLSVVKGVVLDPDLTQGHVLVNGRMASLATYVGDGDAITVVAGPDRVEKTEKARFDISPPATIADLYSGGKSGLAVLVRGVVSHEEVSYTLVRQPILGHLKAPATIALTFDDGPAYPYTSQILALLAAHHAPAVFCMIGQEALAHPELANQIADAGYALCDHTQNHPNLLEVSDEEMVRQISRGYDSIVQTTGVEPLYFRAPGGNWSPAIEAESWREGMVPLHWTVDPTDWARPGVDAIVANVIDHLRPGGVVLLHDGGGDRSQTVEALAELLDELSALGWTFGLPGGA